VKIGVAQIDCDPGNVAANCEGIAAWAKRAKAEGCEALVLPEMIDTGYDLARLRDVASEWTMDRDDSPYAVARRAAHDTGLFLFCGLSERVGEDIFNTAAVFDQRGNLIGRYRKTHLAAYFPRSAGDSASRGPMSWCSCRRGPSRGYIIGGR
jgi:predicted amidohydrolase